MTRAAEQMGASNLAKKRVKNIKASTVSDQLLGCDCSSDFSNFEILTVDTSKFNLLIKESLSLKNDKPVLNRTV